MSWIIFSIVFIIIVLFVAALVKMFYDTMNVIWYKFYEDDDENFE